MTIKRIVSISESENSARPMPMVMMRAMAADASAKSEIVPGEQDIGVTVSVTFELN